MTNDCKYTSGLFPFRAGPIFLYTCPTTNDIIKDYDITKCSKNFYCQKFNNEPFFETNQCFLQQQNKKLQCNIKGCNYDSNNNKCCKLDNLHNGKCETNDTC